MTGALNLLRQSAVERLKEFGLQAVAAMEPENRKRWEGPVAAVSLKKVTCAPGGFRDYLGVYTDPDSGAQQELYGRGVEVTLSLDLYASRDGGESACQQGVYLMVEALTAGSLGGLTVSELETGAVEFLEREAAYRLPVSCVCRGWLTAAGDDSGAFVDFEVKGRRI